MDKLWKDALGAVLDGRADDAAWQQLTHLANERFAPAPYVPVNEQSWSIRSELWDLAQLCLPERKHCLLKPRRLHGPLVVVEFRGRSLLVDGTNRVNYWRANGLAHPQNVLIVAHKEPA